MIDGLATIAYQLSMASTAERYSRHWEAINLAVAAPRYGWREVMATVWRHVKSKTFHRSNGDDDELMRIAIEVARVSDSQKQRSRTAKQRPGSMLTYGEWRPFVPPLLPHHSVFWTSDFTTMLLLLSCSVHQIRIPNTLEWLHLTAVAAARKWVFAWHYSANPPDLSLCPSTNPILSCSPTRQIPNSGLWRAEGHTGHSNQEKHLILGLTSMFLKRSNI